MNIVEYKSKFAEKWVPLNLQKVLFIVLHHPDAKFATPEDIDNWHVARNFLGPGYNEYIRKDGTVVIMRGDNIGAQCENMNSKTYGICCEGDYDVEREMPKIQFDALVDRLKYHSKRLPNLQEIVPHKRFGKTACPGKYFPFEKVIAALKSDPIESTVETMKGLGHLGDITYWTTHFKDNTPVSAEYCYNVFKSVARKSQK